MPGDLVEATVDSRREKGVPSRAQRPKIVLAILSSAFLLCYMDRMAIATAIPFIAQDFGLSPLGMGGVLSAFFAGYALMQLPGGMLSDRFGPKGVMAASIVGWSIFTFATGLATGLAVLLLTRALFGLAEGPYPPSASKTVALVFPADQVGRANGLQLAAVQIGAALSPYFVSVVIAHWGWRAVFFSLFFPGLAIAALIWKFIDTGTAATERPGSFSGARGSSVKEILRRPSVVWCAVTIFFWSCAAWGLMNWLPTYLLKARGFSLARTGVLGSLPYLGGAAGYFLGGYFIDGLFRNRRHVPIAGGLLGGGAVTYLAAVVPGGEWAIAALVAGFLLIFIAAGALFTLPLVMVPKESVGAAYGFVNTAAQLAAFGSPLGVGFVLSVTHENFTTVLFCFVGLFVTAAVTSLGIFQGERLRQRLMREAVL
jgi:MFS family permease